jgi:hypothetical protein
MKMIRYFIKTCYLTFVGESLGVIFLVGVGVNFLTLLVGATVGVTLGVGVGVIPSRIFLISF